MSKNVVTPEEFFNPARQEASLVLRLLFFCVKFTELNKRVLLISF